MLTNRVRTELTRLIDDLAQQETWLGGLRDDGRAPDGSYLFGEDRDELEDYLGQRGYEASKELLRCSLTIEDSSLRQLHRLRRDAASHAFRAFCGGERESIAGVCALNRRIRARVETLVGGRA